MLTMRISLKKQKKDRYEMNLLFFRNIILKLQ